MFRHRPRPHSMVGPRGYVQHKDITISSPNLIGQNISQSELCLNQRKQQVRKFLQRIPGNPVIRGDSMISAFHARLTASGRGLCNIDRV